MPPRPTSRRISYRPTVFMTSGIPSVPQPSVPAVNCRGSPGSNPGRGWALLTTCDLVGDAPDGGHVPFPWTGVERSMAAADPLGNVGEGRPRTREPLRTGPPYDLSTGSCGLPRTDGRGGVRLSRRQRPRGLGGPRAVRLRARDLGPVDRRRARLH